jgi:transcription antitermination protein NusB
MPSRHKSRQRALQILFLVDMRGQTTEEAVASYYGSLYSEESESELQPDPFMEQLIRGTHEKVGEIDEKIVKYSENWRLQRMPAVDRNILRMAIFEMTEVGTPPAVVIDEAIELARRFSGDESVPFINGVLDAVRREHVPPS